MKQKEDRERGGGYQVSIAREYTATRVSNCYIGTRESAEPGETASKADLYLEEDRGRWGRRREI